MNNENLKKGKATQFTGETAAKAGHNGAVKTNQIKAEKKSMRDTMETLLALPVTPKNKALLEQMGIEDNEQSNRMLSCVAIMKALLNENMNAAKIMLGLIGEMPTEKVETQLNFNGGGLAETLAELKKQQGG